MSSKTGQNPIDRTYLSEAEQIPTWKLMIKLADVLKRELKNKKLTEVAKDLDIPKSLLSDWAAGALPAAKNLPRLQRLADYFGISLSELLFSRKDANSTSEVIQSLSFKDGDREYRVLIEKVK